MCKQSDFHSPRVLTVFESPGVSSRERATRFQMILGTPRLRPKALSPERATGPPNHPDPDFSPGSRDSVFSRIAVGSRTRGESLASQCSVPTLRGKSNARKAKGRPAPRTTLARLASLHACSLHRTLLVGQPRASPALPSAAPSASPRLHRQGCATAFASWC